MTSLEYEAEDEYLEEEDAPMDEGTAAPRLKSTITGGEDRKQKGRGFKAGNDGERFAGGGGGGGKYDTLDDTAGPGPAKSIEGWIVLVRGVHEEAQEDDIHEAFAEFGEIQNLHLNLDRRTGFVKGYALLEYMSKKEGLAAIAAMDGTELLDQAIQVGWAFARGPLKKPAAPARRR
mmetsp:Transcript_32625/g.45275  ORF Transcript_32625/g.45275 Transcript_32625/m.45275 type:complete len:176 (-) Transcript_32625:262-789(-)|eukprot:CAMPEP_0196578868 /NCGR_PEP_ID=MMETSP1081-20130531/11594_1 /TAXON_ID=36882 /ORGANISM="Pyramimonas amylifera, Strain CCMP720" /LENGTH=175 /DNA_ID=CAMNT_0041898245 /DNA_START=115 /DNA_END=642 /DNA_ORIENTATION=-